MSFCVAVQSAIFYIVSCAPCHQTRHHQNSKRAAKREREEKARIHAEYPGTYQHPDPFNTNPYWSEEIMMGPHIEAKKYTGGNTGSKNERNESQRGLNSAGKEVASGAGSSVGVNGTNPENSPSTANEDGKLSFSTTLSTNLSDDWNRKRYQREDEELWGHELYRTGHKLMDAIKQAGTSAGRLLEASLGKEAKDITEQDRQNFYFAPRNPPVNDYHPPIVRQLPTHRDGHKWMLQPPPAAKVMEGKVPVSRSASFASHLSRRTTASDGAGLGRLVHERTMEAKLSRGELPTELESNPSLHRPVPKRRSTNTTIGAASRRVSRSRSLSLESSDASDDMVRRRRSRRIRTPLPVDFDSSEEEYFLRSTESVGRGRRAATRPKLQPIPSERDSKDSKERVAKKQRERISPHPATSPSPLAGISNMQEQSQMEDATTLSKVSSVETSTVPEIAV
ncbi:hypothetical protein F5Y15DRAFT_307996 [Xylariaceae sp. FL0016]|nr:hypothetical protein F5Y15DRAFT_307996 [Xylariaceae sp. FL0016]